MAKISTPQASDWNNYWGLDQTERFTKISWSKRRIMTVLAPYIKKDGFALDAGCGSGFFSKFFCDSGMKVTALDYSQEALDIAYKMTNGSAIIMRKDMLADDFSLGFDHRFDLIFSDGLFEHFSREQQDKIMNNLRSVLSDEGVIVTFVPNKWSPWELIRPVFMPGIEEDPFVLNQLRALHLENQLSIVQEGGINTFPFAFSPDVLIGKFFGMLLFVVAKNSKAD